MIPGKPNARSQQRILGRGTERCRTASCCRIARFSAAKVSRRQMNPRMRMRIAAIGFMSPIFAEQREHYQCEAYNGGTKTPKFASGADGCEPMRGQSRIRSSDAE